MGTCLTSPVVDISIFLIPSLFLPMSVSPPLISYAISPFLSSLWLCCPLRPIFGAKGSKKVLKCPNPNYFQTSYEHRNNSVRGLGKIPFQICFNKGYCGHFGNICSALTLLPLRDSPCLPTCPPCFPCFPWANPPGNFEWMKSPINTASQEHCTVSTPFTSAVHIIKEEQFQLN